MTCWDFYKTELTRFLSGILDYFPGIMIVLTMIMIIICFFGMEGKITQKTFFPLIGFLVVSIGSNLMIITYELYKFRNIWDEPYVEGILAVSELSIPNNFLRILYYICIVLTGMLTFETKRISKSILTFVLTLIFTTYLMVETMYSITFFFDDPREEIHRVMMTEGFLGSRISFALEITTTAINIIILLAVYFGMVKKQRTMYVKWKYRIFFAIWAALMFVLLVIPFRPSLSDSEYEKCIRYELGVIMPVLGLVIPFLLITIISRRYVVERTQVQEDYISAELDYLNQYKRDQNEIRDFRHEIMSNLASLSAMYTDKNYDEAGEHLKALLGNVRAMSPKFVTGDEMLDCILGMKSSKMEEEGIEFTVDGILDGGLGMKPVDVCSIFANAIDNAIEACEKLPGGRWIKLSMKRTDKFFSIVLSNSVYKKEDIRFTAILFGDGERVTTKKDRDHHGFGTQNMKATITKYDGIMKINNGDKEFVLSIVIPRAA